MHRWSDPNVEENVAQERYQVIVRSRWVDRQVEVTGSSDIRLHDRVLNWLGRQLERWGRNLQLRYRLPAKDVPCEARY